MGLKKTIVDKLLDHSEHECKGPIHEFANLMYLYLKGGEFKIIKKQLLEYIRRIPDKSFNTSKEIRTFLFGPSGSGKTTVIRLTIEAFE